MATSSIHKEFSLHNREEADAFMKLFEESLRNPPKLEKPAAVMATLEQDEEFFSKLRKIYGSNSSK
ncbi:MAG: hypothetical protein IJU95_08485 [Treponema sp.]|nr:hypothetical protein [Treponema sp.]